jgi:putative membrane protein
MAGMLYLPRLYVYHSAQEKGSETSKLLKVMERKLLRIIINPAMVFTLITGIALIVITGAGSPGSGGWMHAKLVLILGMIVCHALFAKWRKQFERDENTRPERFYRIMNEVPTVLMIAIVLLVVLKPF